MTQRNNSNSVEIDFDDVSEVGAMMQSFLKNGKSILYINQHELLVYTIF